MDKTENNINLLKHVKSYQANGNNPTAEDWVYFTNFINMLGKRVVIGERRQEGFAILYHDIWQDMHDNAMDFLLKTTLRRCDTDDPKKAWSYISKSCFGIFSNTLKKHRRKKKLWEDYRDKIIDEDGLIHYVEDNLEDKDKIDNKFRPIRHDIDGNKESFERTAEANRIIKNGNAEYKIITDDIDEMKEFIKNPVDIKKKLTMEFNDGKVVITLRNGDVGYAGDLLFRRTTLSKGVENKSYWMVIPECMIKDYNIDKGGKYKMD